VTTTHPSPHHDRVDHAWLFAALAAGPAAWIVQLIAGYAIASVACTAQRAAGGASGFAFAGEPAWLIALNLAALVVVVAGGVYCRIAWNRTANEKAGGPEAALTIGSGRTRFLAVWGMMSSVGFSLAVLFDTIEPLLVPGCWTGMP